jgi:hypothetical protein
VKLTTLVDRLITVMADPPPLTTPAQQPIDRALASELLVRVDHNQQRHDGPAWRFVLALARLPLPPAIRPVRDAALDAIADTEQRAVAAALAAIADCAVDGRDPSASERALFNTLLALPVPERRPVEYRRSRRHFAIQRSDPILSGRAEAVAGAIGLVGLSDETARWPDDHSSRASTEPPRWNGRLDVMVEAVDDFDKRFLRAAERVAEPHAERGRGKLCVDAVRAADRLCSSR